MPAKADERPYAVFRTWSPGLVRRERIAITQKDGGAMCHKKYFSKIFPGGLRFGKETTLKRWIQVSFLIAGLALAGCGAPKINLFPDATEPLQEFVLQGKAKGKVLVISVRGFISDSPKKGFLNDQPSMVEEIVSQLRKAEKDKEVRSLLLKIDSPGGSITASDIIYNEIMDFKKRTGAKVVAAMMDTAASGGYYVSLAADYILAHPTTVTGSVGVIFLRPEVSNLMEKIGVAVHVSKSGIDKDMGSPFRDVTTDEREIFQNLIDTMGNRFVELVGKRRNLDEKRLKDIASARIYLSETALKLGLVDKIGYLNDAVSVAKKMSGLPEGCKVVVYRRSKYADDTIYNSFTTEASREHMLTTLIQETMPFLRSGFYYLWYPGAAGF